MESNFNYVRSILSLARKNADGGKPEEGFSQCIALTQKYPQFKDHIHKEILNCLRTLTKDLRADESMEDMFKTFEICIEIYPNNPPIFNELGTYLYRLGYYKEASRHFQMCLSLNAGYVLGERNLNSVKNAMVERWHYRMLNDRKRNEAYLNAISESIKESSLVLDLGTGSGLLSLYAKRQNPRSIVACDSSETMVEIARLVFDENSCSDIKLIQKDSKDLHAEDIDGKKSVALAEIFDAGLLGERCLQTFIHSWENLLLPEARILPGKAEVFVCGIQSDQLSARYRLKQFKSELIKYDGYLIVSSEEPYNTEDLRAVPDWTMITKSVKLFEVDFNCIENLKLLLYENRRYAVNLPVVKNGTIDLLVVWFKLFLTENLVITTDPTAVDGAKAWDQAVFFNFEPKYVTESDTLSYEFTCNGKIALCEEYKDPLEFASSELIRFCNDSELTGLISSSIGTVCIYLGQIVNLNDLNILDLAVFPIFGLLMLLRGARHLTCVALNSKNKEFIDKVFMINGITSERYSIYTTARDVEITLFRNKFHAIYENVLMLNGEINVHNALRMRALKRATLARGGLLLPFKVSLIGALVDSPQIDFVNRVSDENTLNCKIAEFINPFQVSQNLSLEASLLNYRQLSEATTIIDNVQNFMKDDVIELHILEEGDVNAVICWYSIQLLENGPSVHTNRHNSLIDSMSFLAHPKVPVKTGELGVVLCCVDSDESLKLVIDVDV